MTHPLAMNEHVRPNAQEWTVSELSAALRKTVEDAFGYVRVRGEISGYRGPQPSGHCYFALKDETAKIEAVLFRTSFARLRIKPEEGLEVVVSGRLTTYPGKSTYQIVVDTLEPAGLGALMVLLEQRKKALAAEGLFDARRKQLVPFLPQLIGVITSPAGAVIRDILHRLNDRFPRRVLVWPVRVQGEGSAQEIAAAIAGFNALPADGLLCKPSLLIVARGGGSIEDLWSFNEEIVVRAAAASAIPLISAVGHETDMTLIDFAADKRAPTPSAAAEMAVPVRTELLVRVGSLAHRSLACWQRGQEARRAELRSAIRALPGAEQLLAVATQRLDHASGRLPRALLANAQSHHARFSRVAGRLAPHILRTQLARCCESVGALVARARRATVLAATRRGERLDAATARLRASLRANAESHRSRIAHARERVAALDQRGSRAMVTLLCQRVASLDRCAGLLQALSHRGVLARGFALVRDGKRRPVAHAARVNAGMSLDIEFFDGHVRASAEHAFLTPAEKPRPRLRSRRLADAGQGKLFD